MISATTKDKWTAYADRGREISRSLIRRYAPAIYIRPIRESEFLNRLIAMTILTAALGGMITLLPKWPTRFWFEGALLGLALSLTATRRSSRVSLVWRLAQGAMFGIGLQAFTRLGWPLVGMAVMGAGIGAMISKSAGDANSRMDTVLATILSAMLGGWAAMKLAPVFIMIMPREMSVATQWAVIGFFFALGAIPAHIVVTRNTLLIHVRRIRRKLKPENRIHLDRAIDKYFETSAAPAEKNREDVEAVFKQRARLGEGLIEIAESSLALQEVKESLRVISEESLKARKRELEERYNAVDDPGVRGEIDRAITGIEGSLAHREKLNLESERLMLRLFRIGMDMDNPIAAR